MSKMIKGITIEFSEENNSYFENCYEDTIDPNILIISLLETINDICIDFKLDTIEQLSKYIEIGSIDNYIGDFEKQQIKTLQTDFFNQKDQRIAELEEELASQNFNELVKKKYDSLKEAIKFLWEKQITDEHIFYVIDQLGQQHIDRIQDIENGICKIERLEKELAELKENAVVPKFKINYIVWYVGNDKVQKGTIEEIRYYKTTGISYYLPNLQRETFWIYESELFATKSEAEEALKKLEE